MMKYTLFVILAVFTAQGIEARTALTSKAETRGLIEDIKHVIAKLKEAIEQIVAKIPEIIANIKQAIEAVVGKLPELIEQIRDEIKEIIQQGETAKQCAEAQREQVEALVTNTQQGVQNCVSEAQAQTGELQTKVDALVEQGKALLVDISDRVFQCIYNNLNDQAAMVRCLREQVGPVREQVEALAAEIGRTIALAEATAQEVVASLSKCVSGVEEQAQAQFQAIVGAIQECIAASA